MPDYIPGGYVMLSRTILESDVWFESDKTLRIAVYLLLVANHSKGKVGPVAVNRGQTYRTLSRIAEENAVSIKSVRTSLDHLCSIGYITKEPVEGARKGQRITICNYDTYQNPANYEGHTNGHNDYPKKAPNNNDKKVKNEKKTNTTIVKSNIPTIGEVNDFFTSKGSSADEGTKFFEHFSLADWHDSRGKKMKYWKQNAAGWINRNKDRITTAAPKKKTMIEKNAEAERIKLIPEDKRTVDQMDLLSRYLGTVSAREDGVPYCHTCMEWTRNCVCGVPA